jgi:uncharacterized protein
MIKYLLLALVVIWLLYSPAIRRRVQVRRPVAPANRPPQPSTDQPEPMVRCAHCGVHLPAKDALTDAQGQTYCNQAHRQAGAVHS